MALFVVGLGLLSLSGLSADDFSYEGNRGPSHWGENFQTCIGRYQSPINIEENAVTVKTFPALEFTGLLDPHLSNITNNGHTVMVETIDPEPATISGGPLKETYVFKQIHFHWGENDRVGSEDLINNQSFSMELHAVFYKKIYGSMMEATQHPDGLAVLGYMYQVVNQSNPTFDPLVEALPDIKTVDTIKTISEPMILSKLIVPNPSTMQSYYTYRGSLTTPPCLEIVTWIDFTQPQSLSHEQLDVFRNILTPEGQNLTHNFRPVQPLDGRVVYHNDPNYEQQNRDSETHNNSKDNNSDKNSGQQRLTIPSYTPLTVLGAFFLLPHP